MSQYGFALMGQISGNIFGTSKDLPELGNHQTLVTQQNFYAWALYFHPERPSAPNICFFLLMAY